MQFQLPRLFGWFIVATLLLIALAVLMQNQPPPPLYRVPMAGLGGVLGYWLDRAIFPYARPHDLCAYMAADDLDDLTCCPDVEEPIEAVPNPDFNMLFTLAMQRRAIIVGCAMLAVGGGF